MGSMILKGEFLLGQKIGDFTKQVEPIEHPIIIINHSNSDLRNEHSDGFPCLWMILVLYSLTIDHLTNFVREEIVAKWSRKSSPAESIPHSFQN
jgi:hypothetical protein